MKNSNDNVIFFDGVCGLCNGFVDFILRIDQKQKFYFSPLQGELALKTLPAKWTEDLSSVVLLKNGVLYSKSNAVIEILSDIGGVWKIILIGKWLPEKFRNSLYDLIASNRYRLFGKKETCRLPSFDERQRFLN